MTEVEQSVPARKQSVKLIIKLMCAELIGTKLDIEISVCNHE